MVIVDEVRTFVYSLGSLGGFYRDEVRRFMPLVNKNCASLTQKFLV